MERSLLQALPSTADLQGPYCVFGSQSVCPLGCMPGTIGDEARLTPCLLFQCKRGPHWCVLLAPTMTAISYVSYNVGWRGGLYR